MILAYIIKSSLCFGVLFGFYKLALEHKAMHQFKRFYLLASLVFAFTIPLVTFTYTVNTLPEPEPLVNAYEYYSNPIITEEPIAVAPEFPILPVILWSIYGLCVLIFGLRFVLNLVRLDRKINTSQQIKETHFTLSLLNQAVIPHSFLQWIFLNKTAYHNQDIASEVLAHEATHVRQKHSLDILFIEFIQIVFWFNPLVWVAKKSIKLNHEFLADQGAIASDRNIAIYQNILLSYASSTNHTVLESPFNYSLTKKRILMLSQTFSRKRAALSALLLLPIVAVCLFLFNNEIKAQEKITHNQDHISQFIKGAKRNGHKPLVIEIKNDNITINGEASTIYTFQKDIDVITKDWNETDFTSPAKSFLFKDNSGKFLKKVEIEYLKTHISKANGGASLVPPPPPPPPSVEDHLFKMKKINSEFYYEKKKVSYEKALQLLEKNSTLNVETPYPYSTPPKTYISQSGFTQKPKIQPGDTLTITVTDTGKKHQVVINEKNDAQLIENIKQELEKAEDLDIRYIAQNPPTNEEITIYNSLAKKYRTNPNGVVIQKEVALMQNIYCRMTPEQKKAAEALPNKPSTPPNIQQKDLLAPLPIKKQIENNNNPKKFFIQLEDNQIRINGNPVSLDNFAKEFDKSTRNWTSEDFEIDKEAKNTILANLQYQLILDYDFVKALEKEMRKTDYFKNTGRLKIPTTAIPSNIVAGYLFPKLSDKWDFYFDDKPTTLNKAKTLIRQEELITYKIFNSTSDKTPSIYFYKYTPEIPENHPDPLTPKKLKIYNDLAKKYRTNPNGVIIQKEVALMQNIYSRMTPEQKKAAEALPNIPPPPPPTSGKVKNEKMETKQVASNSNKAKSNSLFKQINAANSLKFTAGKTLNPSKQSHNITETYAVINPSENKSNKNPGSSTERKTQLKLRIERHALNKAIFQLHNEIITKEKA